MILRAALLWAALPVSAQQFPLTFPVDCTLGETCHIQHFVDRDPGPGARDYTCGPLTYDTHQGTDIRLNSRAAMRAGVAVLAAAPGRVRAIRDGMPDIASDNPDAPDLAGRECGNGILVRHPGGWETQYCHLKKDSVLVRAGDEITRGQRLALVGQSGNAQFPHLHLSLRKDGAEVDPFAPDLSAACGNSQTQLWSPPLSYDPGGILALGIATKVPDYDAVRDGPEPINLLSTKAPALVAWAFLFGTRSGDELRLRILGPQGVINDHAERLDRTQAQAYRAAGRRAPGAWEPGAYRVEVQHLRGGKIMETREHLFRIE